MRGVLVLGGVVLTVFWLVSGLSAAKGDAAKGKKIFETLCVGCHGSTGKGDGTAAAALNPKPKDMSDKAYMSKLSDEYLHEITAKGGAALKKSQLMPGWNSTLKDGDLWNVVAYIRSLAK